MKVHRLKLCLGDRIVNISRYNGGLNVIRQIQAIVVDCRDRLMKTINNFNRIMVQLTV